MKKYEFQKDRDVESWMRPFTGAVLMPGLRRTLRTDTRLFFDLYWQLLSMGYTESQIANRTVHVRWSSTPPLHEDIAIVRCVFDLARQHELGPSPKLPLYLGDDHPRRIVDRFK